MFLWLRLTVSVHTMSRVKKQISRKFIQRSAPRMDSHEWHEMWQKMKQFFFKSSAPGVWKFIPEQLQDLAKVTEYLQGACCGDSRKGQLIVACWAWLLFTGHSSTLDSTLRGKRKKTDLQALWPDLQLNPRNHLCQ